MISVDEPNMISSHDSRWFLPHDVDEIAGDEGIRLDILVRVYIYTGWWYTYPSEKDDFVS